MENKQIELELDAEKQDKINIKLSKLKSIEEQMSKLNNQMDYIQHKLKILEKVLKGV